MPGVAADVSASDDSSRADHTNETLSSNLKLAEEQFLYVLALEPDHFDALYNLALINIKRSDYVTAEQFLNRCLEIDPENMELYMTLSIVYENL